MHPELVITGMGAVGAFGNSPEDLWQALLRKVPLYGPARRCPGDHMTAEITDFNLDWFRRTAKGHRAPRGSQYALAAAAQAIEAANLSSKAVEKDAVSVVYGTGNGPSDVTERNLAALFRDGLGGIEPLCFQESVFNAPASLISIEYGFRGPLLALPMGWAAGSYAVAAAADLIEFGHANVALVVASDELTSLCLNTLAALGLVSPSDGLDQKCRPFDRRHNGAVLSEGGAALVLETRAHALARGAKILMALSGWGIATDAFGIGPKSAGEPALGNAMQMALEQAGHHLPGLVYSGSYCTPDADGAEARAIAARFHPRQQPRVTNIRGITGEAKGVCGLYNLIAAEASLRTGILPATEGCTSPDPACELDIVREQAICTDLNAVMCNAFWVNGTNASLIVRRPS